jgi:hypothetical protein
MDKGKGKGHPRTGHEGARWWWLANATPLPLYARTRCPLYRRLGGPQGLVWTGAENLASPPVCDTVLLIKHRYFALYFGPSLFIYFGLISDPSRSRLPRGLMRRLQPLAFWDCGFESRHGHGCLSVSFECFVLSGGGLCDGPIPHPEESYQLRMCPRL